MCPLIIIMTFAIIMKFAPVSLKVSSNIPVPKKPNAVFSLGGHGPSAVTDRQFVVAVQMAAWARVHMAEKPAVASSVGCPVGKLDLVCKWKRL